MLGERVMGYELCKDIIINTVCTVYSESTISICMCIHESLRESWINLAEAYTVYCRRIAALLGKIYFQIWIYLNVGDYAQSIFSF